MQDVAVLSLFVHSYLSVTQYTTSVLAVRRMHQCSHCSYIRIFSLVHYTTSVVAVRRMYQCSHCSYIHV